jgi:hypothetical protein
MCAICRENFDHDPRHYLRDCYHAYHAHCIIAWMRQDTTGRCPLCRDASAPQLACVDAFARCTFLRRKARNASAPCALKRAVGVLRKKEENARGASKELSAFQKTHKPVISKLRRLRNRYYRTNHAVRIEKRVLGLSSFDGVEVPLLPRSRARSRRRSFRRL